ncbi:hypothetical protein SY27_09535 [Flavobacterium sp. 316]|uniref:Uncharacterized protein n=1 Tax=Flavobacterium sediminilitoris TaxID=2024526 RepID=A0ABY4HU67_9FLAO|nr:MULTISPECIES: hypothetical protein [Flavobacterium]KIX21009.1 hypothetical protein SY27_09535 [Flavobacterium sp. 316]UOX35269.1 hypothetical protein LXD69_07060 [Flavobacterium sediminilitoris]
MKKKDLFIGLIIGLLGALIGTFIALQFFTEQGFVEGFKIMKSAGMIGKVITLGAIPNVVVFFLLLKKNKDLMARGIILAMFIITITTLLL